jgi:hypothetical protein
MARRRLAVHDWAVFGIAEEHRKELLREAQGRRLARELREARKARAKERRGRSHLEATEGIEVRWGLLKDGPRIAEILELNGMPRWVAFEEHYIVAERDGEVLGALRYRTESKRLLLGLLVGDPRAEERPLAVALYVGAGELAREIGIGEVVARSFPRADSYPREAGYSWWGPRQWRLEAAQLGEMREEPAGLGWQRLFGLLGLRATPFAGLLRRQG